MEKYIKKINACKNKCVINNLSVYNIYAIFLTDHIDVSIPFHSEFPFQYVVTMLQGTKEYVFYELADTKLVLVDKIILYAINNDDNIIFNNNHTFSYVLRYNRNYNTFNTSSLIPYFDLYIDNLSAIKKSIRSVEGITNVYNMTLLMNYYIPFLYVGTNIYINRYKEMYIADKNKFILFNNNFTIKSIRYGKNTYMPDEFKIVTNNHISRIVFKDNKN